MRKLAIPGVILVVVLVAAFWFFSPYLAIHEMMGAARDHNPDKFSEHVDYPALRDSLKGEFSARLNQKMGGQDKSNAFAGFAMDFAQAIVNRMIDTMVKPEAVMAMMRNAKTPGPAKRATDSNSHPTAATGAQHADSLSATPVATTTDRDSTADWQLKRTSMDDLVAYAPDTKNTPLENRLALVFHRYGFASWKLNAVHLPVES